MDALPTFNPGDEALAVDLNAMTDAINVATGATPSVAQYVSNLGPMPWTPTTSGRIPMPIASCTPNVADWVVVTDAANGRVQFLRGGLVYISFGAWGVDRYWRMRNQGGTQIAAGFGSGSNIIQINAGDVLHAEVEVTAGDALQDPAWTVLDLRATV